MLLHGTGVLVSVPAPQRFALHKLIVARRRHEEGGKREKDISQAGALLDVLAERRPHELRAAWEDAFARGRTWRRLIGEGLGLLHPTIRDKVLQTVGATRDVVPGLKSRLVPNRYVYDDRLDAVCFFAQAGKEGISCVVARDAMAMVAGTSNLDRERVLETLVRFRTRVEQIIEAIYLRWPVIGSGQISVSRADIEALTPAKPPARRSAS